MKRPRWGLSVRTMLIIVAAYAAGLTTAHMKLRWVYCHRVADCYRSMLAETRHAIDHMRTNLESPDSTPDARWLAESYARMRVGLQEDAIKQESRMRQFERAAYMPWFPLPEGPKEIARPDF